MVQTTSNSNHNANNTLSIQVSLNGLSFCTVNEDRMITSLEQEDFGIQLTPSQVLDKIKQAFDSYPSLQKDFKTVIVLYQNDLCTLIPEELFDENCLKEYLQYNIRVLENDFIAYDELKEHGLVNVYIPYININNFFFESFGSFTYQHTTSILVNNLLAREKNNEKVVVYANMNKKLVDILIFEKGKLVFSNTFFHENEEDFLYYLLFAAEQLRLNPEKFQLVFLGDIAKESDYYAIAYNYILQIGFGETLRKANYSKEIILPDAHKHFTLLNSI